MLKMLNRIADFLAHNRGLLTLIGIGLILSNLLLQFFPTLGWLRESNLLLHLGIVLGLAGILIANAL
jgi:hypothetical protein